MSWFEAVAVAVLLVTAPGSALALGRQGTNLSGGVAVSGEVEGGKGRGGVAVDLSVHPVTGTWVSAGVRSGTGPARVQVEAGVWFVGVGWAHDTGTGDWATGFVGVPWGLAGIGQGEPWWGVYVEPYWRPAYRLAGDGGRWRHEVGLMVKVTTVKIGSWAEPRG